MLIHEGAPSGCDDQQKPAIAALVQQPGLSRAPAAEDDDRELQRKLARAHAALEQAQAQHR